MPSPFFSIVIPTYNRGVLLRDTVDSLLSQTNNDFEIIIVDDGSTDNTESVIASLQDEKIKYFKVTNRERGAARNFGAKKAKGQYINFFDSDDIAYPNHLQLAADIISNQSKLDVFAVSYDIKTSEGLTIKKVTLNKKVSSFICEGNHLSCNGVFVRKAIALKNPFSEIRALSGSEDYELWLRLSARFSFQCFPEISHAVIHHPQRSTLNFEPEPLIKRKEIMLTEALKDPIVIREFQPQIEILESSTYAYIALHIAMSGTEKREALKWLFKSIMRNTHTVFTRRFLATIKYLMISR